MLERAHLLLLFVGLILLKLDNIRINCTVRIVVSRLLMIVGFNLQIYHYVHVYRVQIEEVKNVMINSYGGKAFYVRVYLK